MSQRGKNARDDYTALGVRIPKALKRRLAAKLAFYDDLNTSTAVERLLELWITGQVEIGVPADAPQDVYNAVNPKTPQAVHPATITNQDNANLQTKSKTPAATAAFTYEAKASAPAGANEFESIRQQLGLSQRAFADALGVHHSSVGKYRKQGCPEDVLERARALLEG